MKKGKLLNSEVSYLISTLGHTDQITIADAGLPIPDNNQRIDLALTAGTPTFIETLRVVLEEMQVEHMILATEIADLNPTILKEIQTIQAELKLEIEFVSHNDFKALTAHSKGIIRTGECSPYANIILQSGVAF